MNKLLKKSFPPAGILESAEVLSTSGLDCGLELFERRIPVRQRRSILDEHFLQRGERVSNLKQ